MDPIYNATEIPVEVNCWKKPGVPTMWVSVVKLLIAAHLKKDRVVVNVNGGPHMTYVGLVTQGLA